MTQLRLTNDGLREDLFPFSLIRSVADIRVGILTIREKWAAYLEHDVQDAAEYSINNPPDTVLPANILPSRLTVEKWKAGVRLQDTDRDSDFSQRIRYPWDIVRQNDQAIRDDFNLICNARRSAPIPDSVMAINPGEIFIEAGAKLSHCILNAEAGPIYIGPNSTIMEGATIRGPFALCEGATVKMGARIYGATTIGPYSVVGGEIKNSILLGFSNKAHDGYLGDSVIGEWCNLGAGTTNSNLKNNMGTVNVFNPYLNKYLPAGSKCGLFLGDYSQSAINTSFNTGTITGICVNVFGSSSLTPKYIPSFSWGSSTGERYRFDSAISAIENWKKLKDKAPSEEEIQKLRHIFDQL